MARLIVQIQVMKAKRLPVTLSQPPTRVTRVISGKFIKICMELIKRGIFQL